MSIMKTKITAFLSVQRVLALGALMVLIYIGA